MHTIGPYRILEELGRGGMGVVYRARDRRDGEIVALKTLLDFNTDLDLLERFRRETTLLRGLRHPNLVRVLDLNLQPPQAYAAFEYVAGDTLKARVEREGPLPWELAVRVLSEVAAGVAAAHERGLLHRDIKPENVLLGEEGAKLVDFGMVKDFHQGTLTHTGALVGSPSYMSPEQAHGDKARWGTTTDVYGLAATLFFALTGQPPFKGTSQIATLTSVLEDPAPSARDLRPEVPVWLDALCRRGMAKQNGERFPHAVAFRAALQHGGGRKSANRNAPWLGALLGLALVLAIVVWTPRSSGPISTDDPTQPSFEQPTADEVDALLVAGRAKGFRDDFSGALADFDRAIEIAPDPASAYAERAWIRLAQGQSKEALEDCERALELDPECAQAYAHRGAYYYVEEQLAQAYADFERALDLDPNNVAAYRNRALAFAGEQRLEEALADQDRAIELEPGLSLSHVYRASTLQELGRGPEALAALNQAVKLDPNYPQAYAHRGLFRDRQGSAVEALADYDRALDLRPDFVAVLGRRGRIRADLGLLRQGLQDLDRCLEFDPKNASVFADRAWTKSRLGRQEEAQQDVERALEIDPGNAQANASLAIVRYQQRRWPEAASAAEHALALDETNSDAWSVVGALQTAQGRLGEAAGSYERAIELAPQSPQTLTLRGTCYSSLNRLDEALADYTRALALDPQLTAAYEHRGYLLTKLGRNEEAIQDLDRAIELDATYGRAFAIRATCKANIARLTEAVADYERALELGLDDPNEIAHVREQLQALRDTLEKAE